MPEARPAVPSALKLALFEEAGYRCAIPTCRGTAALEMAHITPWAEVREHAFSNMIVLCAVDHTRLDQGQIPSRSIRVYKSNLGVVNGRYSEVERRLLETFAENGVDSPVRLDNGDLVRLVMRNLVRDHLVDVSTPRQMQIVMSGQRHGGWDHYTLTAEGKEFVRRWFSAEPLEASLLE